MKLIIVESPGKTKKIQSFLGAGWKVMASIGHVRDLPVKKMGVEAPNFTPEYVATERGKEVIARLKAAVSSAEDVYLATDPDREGEAISWHLAEALQLQRPKRITFGEITEKAVRKALAQSRDLDMRLVQAQEGRRVLDRFCGYLVSNPLSKAAGTNLSAGRVQSPAVRLVVERERQIKAFTVTTHYGVELIFGAVDSANGRWKAFWQTKNWLPKEQEYILDSKLAEKIAQIRTLDVMECKESKSRTAPPAPFTTSTLQQAASNALKFAPKHTMALAQKLYEQGHITYMRTDSPNFSEDFIEEARTFCRTNNLPLVPKPRHWKSKEGAQEAHEAIRPTHIDVEEAGENADEKALYRLIRLRSLACMLDDAVYAVRTVKLQAEMDAKEVFFEAKGRTLVSLGWKILTAKDQVADADEPQEPENPVPKLQPKTTITALDGLVQIKKTKPPKRYSEASLVAELEKKGIGRPSTYAAILDNIIAKKAYLTIEKRFLVPTSLGELVVDNLCGKFAFVDFDFTRKMEDSLDKIAEGTVDYKSLVAEAYSLLQKEIATFRGTAAISCPECKSWNLRHLLKKASQNDPKEYDFFSCPDCKNTFPNVAGKPGLKQEKKEKPKPTQFLCTECQKPLFHRTGTSKKTGKPYDFFACSGFPACKATFQTKKDGTPELR